MKKQLVVTACFLISAGPLLLGQALEVVPNRVMPDESAVLRVHGLEPNEKITIQADLVDGGGQPWNASAEFIADAQGTVDASKQAPVSGSYKVVSSMGLLWSMMPKEKGVSAYRLPKELGAQTIQLRLSRKGQQAAAAQLEQRSLAADVKRVDVQGTLHGVLYEPLA